MVCYQLLDQVRHSKMETSTFRLSDYLLDIACPPAAVPPQMLDDDQTAIWRKITPINETCHLLEDWFVSNGTKKRDATINEDGYADGHYREWYENGTPRLDVWYKDGRVTGSFCLWYSNGQLAASCIVDADGHGVYKAWHKDGRRRRQH
jgi:antitoxin component YwqK of YwqJK toxin-antitoxin module